MCVTRYAVYWNYIERKWKITAGTRAGYRAKQVKQAGNAVNSQFTKARPRTKANIRNKVNDVVVNADDGAVKMMPMTSNLKRNYGLSYLLYVCASTCIEVGGQGMAN